MINKPELGPIITETIPHWKSAFKHAQKRSFPANYTILHPGSVSNSLYYIISGEVLVSRYSNSGDLNKLFILRKNSILGLTALFYKGGRVTAALTSLTPCECYIFSKEYVYKQMPRELLLDLLEQMSAMSGSMSRRVVSSVNGAEVRLAQFFLHLLTAVSGDIDEIDQDVVTLQPGVTQKMASELLGMHHVTLNRVVGIFREQGVVGKFAKNNLEILDIPTLKKYAAGEMPSLKY